MAKLTLENLINILERKGGITKKDIKYEANKIKSYEDQLRFKNIFSKEEQTAIHTFLKETVLEDNSPGSPMGGIYFHQIIKPIATRFKSSGGLQDIGTLYKLLLPYRNEHLDFDIKSVLKRLKSHIPKDYDDNF